MSRGLAVREVFDVVIIGGGVTGCAAGILLVRRGLRVAMVEGFPWEWWLDEPAEKDAFLNFSGGVLYGVPGSRGVSNLLSELGLSLSNPRGEGHVSFATMEPALQMVTPRRRLNLASSLDESVREMERVFPGWGPSARKLWERASSAGEDLAAPPPKGGGVERFLNAWEWRWKTLSTGRHRASDLIASLPAGSPLATMCRLLLFTLSRRRPEEATAGELEECLRLVTTPSCLVNETGQWGVLLALKAVFRKLGGVVYHSDQPPGVSLVARRRIGLAVGDRHRFETGWLVLDGPEGQLDGILAPFRSGWEKNALRPAVHHTWRLPSASLPEAMAGHLVSAGEEGAHPLVLTLSPRGEEWTLVETITAGGRDEPPEAATAVVRERLKTMLPFLPSNVEPLVARQGWLPSCHGGGPRWDGLWHAGPPLDRANFRRCGRCVLVGRGDYLGSSLNGALADGRRLASWLLRRTDGR